MTFIIIIVIIIIFIYFNYLYVILFFCILFLSSYKLMFNTSFKFESLFYL